MKKMDKLEDELKNLGRKILERMSFLILFVLIFKYTVDINLLSFVELIGAIMACFVFIIYTIYDLVDVTKKTSKKLL